MNSTPSADPALYPYTVVLDWDAQEDAESQTVHVFATDPESATVAARAKAAAIERAYAADQAESRKRSAAVPVVLTEGTARLMAAGHLAVPVRAPLAEQSEPEDKPTDFYGAPMDLVPLAVFAGHLEPLDDSRPRETRLYTVVTGNGESGDMFTDYVSADTPGEVFQAANDHHCALAAFAGHHAELLHHGQHGWHPTGRSARQAVSA